MLGFSVFMGEELTKDTLQYIQEMAALGFGGIFTSMHIPEDDPKAYRQRLLDLGAAAKAQGLELMVDVSGEALERAGFDRKDPAELLAGGVTGLRMDYHISNADIAALSRKMKIALNASTLTDQDIQELQEFQADFDQLEAWHNYYPRPETGLDRQWLLAKNRWLRGAGFTVQAFVPGDDTLRGPLYQGLPTLEEHRGGNPLAAALDLLRNVETDLVYIGDGGLSLRSRRQFQTWLQEQTIVMAAEVLAEESFALVAGDHINRQDEARDVIRSGEARFKKISEIKAEKTLQRDPGSITIDNQLYQRYMGEIQICKVPLAADEKVNVAGKIIATDLDLVSQIKAGDKFRIERVEKS